MHFSIAPPSFAALACVSAHTGVHCTEIAVEPRNEQTSRPVYLSKRTRRVLLPCLTHATHHCAVVLIVSVALQATTNDKSFACFDVVHLDHHGERARDGGVESDGSSRAVAVAVVCVHPPCR